MMIVDPGAIRRYRELRRIRIEDRRDEREDSAATCVEELQQFELTTDLAVSVLAAQGHEWHARREYDAAGEWEHVSHEAIAQ